MYTIADIMECLKLNETTVRKMFVDAGVELDENALNPNEQISRENIIDLLVDRASTREGRLLSKLLEKVD